MQLARRERDSQLGNATVDSGDSLCGEVDGKSASDAALTATWSVLRTSSSRGRTARIGRSQHSERGKYGGLKPQGLTQSCRNPKPIAKVRNREKIHHLGLDFVLPCFRHPLCSWLGIVNPTANPVVLRKSYEDLKSDTKEKFHTTEQSRLSNRYLISVLIPWLYRESVPFWGGYASSPCSTAVRSSTIRCILLQRNR